MRLSSPCQRTAIVLVLAALSSLTAKAQTAPDVFLGHRVGEDRKLADYSQIRAYFEKLDQESPRLQLLTIGASTLKKPMIMAVISAEENLARLDAYRETARRLKEARGLSPEEARKLAKEGKVILLITCSLHATEIGASQMAMELAYDLVSGKTPFDAGTVLKDVIVLLAPTINPDGHQMVTDWYRKHVGTKHEGSSMPWLYHHYAGHDNNRDWFMMNLPETRAISNVLYHEWFPQIHIDEHQMGSTEARLFIPPFMDPPIPNVQPLLWRGVNLCGTDMAYDLQKNGLSGIVHGRSFTGWWIGACDDTGWLHNVVGLLSEMASVRVASPIFIEPTEIHRSYAEKRMEFPDPWPGGWWRLRDIVDYELTLSMSLINTAGRRKEDFLYNSYLMSKTSIEMTEKNQPFAFVIPSRQHDYLTMLKMVDILLAGGLEIQRAGEDFIADGKVYPAGSFIVFLAQPYKAYAWALLEKQKYPDLREYDGGPPVPPYDNAAWTLPLQMGVACEQIQKPFEAKFEKIDKAPYPQVPSEQGRKAYFMLDDRLNDSYAVIFALLKEKAEVYRTTAAVNRQGRDIPAGCFIVKNTPKIQEIAAGLLKRHNMAALDIEDISDFAKAPVKFPRVGLYQSWRPNMDEGWTRYMLDDLGIPFTTIHNANFKAAKGKKVDLAADFDVIIFADEGAEIIKTGKQELDSEYDYPRTPLPPEYEGGIGSEGVAALKSFVEGGGRLVTLNEACNLVQKEFEPPVRNDLEGMDSTKFFCPTSILKLKVDPSTPLGYGLSEETPAVFSESLAFRTWIPTPEWDRKVVASYAEDDVLMSGWLLGEEFIARKAAVVDTRYKKGRIILIGIRAQHRAQAHGTYKFLLNALLYPEL